MAKMGVIISCYTPGGVTRPSLQEADLIAADRQGDEPYCDDPFVPDRKENSFFKASAG
jgi:hypothetical protein